MESWLSPYYHSLYGVLINTSKCIIPYPQVTRNYLRSVSLFIYVQLLALYSLQSPHSALAVFQQVYGIISGIYKVYVGYHNGFFLFRYYSRGTYITTNFYIYTLNVFLGNVYRVKTVFHGSAYQLSKCSIYSFRIIYVTVGVGAMSGFAGLFIHPLLYAIGYMFGFLCAMFLAIYLPSLFIYKLYQINNNMMKANMTNDESNSAPSRTRTRSVSRSKPQSQRGNNDTNAISTVIRKCIILTMTSSISTMTNFVCLIIATFVYGNVPGFNLLVIWGYTLILDLNSNFICVMLSNSFCDDYYLKMCGYIERCLCENDNDIPMLTSLGSFSPRPPKPEIELSSYIESEPQTKDTQNGDQMDELDLDGNEDIP